ncbi:MAG: serine/threonine protein kinase [Lentisphaeria bacterium]|jgi:serine/threonine protein kinase
MDIAAQTQPAVEETAPVREQTDVISYDDQGRIVPGRALTSEEELLNLPDCQIISRLGRGGMGAVFLAKQKRLDRLVAVKMLSKAVAANPEFVEKLQREAVTLAALNHPNVVGCHDIITTEQGVFLIMEYIPGQLTARDLVLRLGCLPEPVVARIMLDVVKGLSYIHEKGFTHRDLKPDNLMLFWDKPQPPRTCAELFADTQTRITICDFGISQHKSALAKAVDKNNPTADNDSNGNSVLGSPTFMAPEQVYAWEDVDFRADIYSLASTVFFLLTKTPPFVETDRTKLIENKIQQDMPDPRLMGAKISGTFARILCKMGRAEPDERYDNYHDLMQDLERVLSAFGTHSIEKRKLNLWRTVSIGLGLLVCLAGFHPAKSYIHSRYFEAKQISLASSLYFWNGNRSDWTCQQRDAESDTAVLTGMMSHKPLELRQALINGQSLHIKIRLPSVGKVSCYLYDLTGERCRLTWKRNASWRSLYRVASGRQNIPIGFLPDRKAMEWLACDFCLEYNRLVLYLDGKIAGVAHLNPPVQSCNFAIEVDNSALVQIKDVFINDL